MQKLIEEVKEINEGNDLFGTYQKACAICDFLELDDNKELLSKNNLIAIYGPWGSGKSCLMKTIAQKLNSEKFDVSWFDTWKYEKDKNLAYSLFKYIAKENFWDEIRGKGSEIFQNIYGIFKCFSKGINVNVNAIDLNLREVLDEAEKIDIERHKKIEDEKCFWEKVNEFEKCFSEIKLKDNKRLIVFLDDLDRCESENIINLISAIKQLISINSNIIFIIGIDKKAVTLALKNKYNNDMNKADEYLEKIFSITFDASNSMKNNKLLDYISAITGLDFKGAETIFLLLKYLHFENPRHIKKVLRKYYMIKNYIREKGIEIDNEYAVMFIIYIIILNVFYNDEYLHLLHDDKEKIYEKISLTSRNSDGIVYRSRFNSLDKKCFMLASDIYRFLIVFSSYELEKYDLNALKYSGGAQFEYENWKYLFNKNICMDFIDFVLDDNKRLNFFLLEKTFDYEKVRNYLNIIKDII